MRSPSHFDRDDGCGLSVFERRSLGDVQSTRRRRLTLAIVGIEPNVIVCDDFYGALAKNTGTVQ